MSKADVDRAAGRLYRLQFRLGMLDDTATQPYVHLGPEDVDSAEGRAAALQAAEESLLP